MSTFEEEYELVNDFASDMRRKLAEPRNRSKTSWKDCALSYLMGRLDEELEELRDEIVAYVIDDEPLRQRHARAVIDEAADVGNFAAFIANAVRHDAEPVQRRQD